MPLSSPRLEALLLDLALLEKVDDHPGQAHCLRRIARLSLKEGASARAARACRFGLQAADGEPGISGELYAILAAALLHRGHLRLAAQCYLFAESFLRQAGRQERALAAALSSSILSGALDAEAARERLLALLHDLAQASSPGLFSAALIALGDIDLRDGDSRQALLCARTAQDAQQRAGLPQSGEAASLLGSALAGLGQWQGARDALTQAVALLDGGPPAALSQAMEALGWVLLELGEAGQALALLGDTLHLLLKEGGLLQAARVELLMATAHLRENPTEALRHVVAGVDLLGRTPSALPAELIAGASDLLRSLPQGRPDNRLIGQLKQRLHHLSERSR